MRGPQKQYGTVLAEPIAAERVSATVLNDARQGSTALRIAVAQYHIGMGRTRWSIFL